MTPGGLELSARGISHREFVHPGPVESLQQAAEERGQAEGQVVRSILFHIAGGEYVLVLAGGPSRIDWGSLRRHLGVSRVRMATPDEVLEVTGFELGAVGPFGLPRPLRTLVAPQLFDQEEVSIGSGVRGTAIMLRTGDLRDALGSYEEFE